MYLVLSLVMASMLVLSLPALAKLPAAEVRGVWGCPTSYVY